MSIFLTKRPDQRREQIKTPIHHGDFFVLRHLKYFTSTYIPIVIKPGMRVADIGCGGQPLRELIESCEAWLTDTSLKSTIGSAQRTYLDSTNSVTEDLCQSISL